MEDLGLLEAIRTLRQVTRYKPDPVPIKDIESIIDAATKAPSGSNSQPWEFVVVTDRARIRKLGELYREIWMDVVGWTPSPDETPVYRDARHLANHMAEVPAIVLVCVDHSRGYLPYQPGKPINRGCYASSIFPAVQNLFLAARGLGLGTRLTLTHEVREEEFRAVVDLPGHIEIVCLTPLGYAAQSFGPPRRRPASEVTSFNTFGNRQPPWASSPEVA